MLCRRASLNAQHLKRGSRWTAAAEDLTGCHSYQLRKGNWGCDSPKLVRNIMQDGSMSPPLDTSFPSSWCFLLLQVVGFFCFVFFAVSAYSKPVTHISGNFKHCTAHLSYRVWLKNKGQGNISLILAGKQSPTFLMGVINPCVPTEIPTYGKGIFFFPHCLNFCVTRQWVEIAKIHITCSVIFYRCTLGFG